MLSALIPIQLLLILANSLGSNAECQCGIFLMAHSDTSAIEEVYLGPTHPQECDRLEVDQLCRDFCYQKFVNITTDGHLHLKSTILNMTSGDMFCENLQQDVVNREVAGYYRWCQTSWKFVGIKTCHPLCCVNSTYVRCAVPDDQLESVTNTTVESAVLNLPIKDENVTRLSENPDKENVTDPESHVRNRRNLVKILQVPRKTSGNSIGTSASNNKSQDRAKRNASQSTTESVETLNPTSEALTSNTTLKPRCSHDEDDEIITIPLSSAKNSGTGTLEKRNDTKRSKKEDQSISGATVQLTKDILVVMNDTTAGKQKSMADFPGQTTTELPLNKETETQLSYKHPNYTEPEADEVAMNHTDFTATDLSKFSSNPSQNGVPSNGTMNETMSY